MNVLRNLFLFALIFCVEIKAQKKVFPGADESTPSRAQYFSWINNTNEGATEEHTRINLDFFQWLQDEYGMVLDIYAYDAGAIDGAKFYGNVNSDRFKRQFPNGFEPNYKQAKAMGTRLGIWGGPDGFGDTPEEEKARREQMVKLCRDYEFELFKFDAVCGPLRPEKEDAFITMMEECRKYSPNLILLNHRLGLDKAKDQATTFLWGGQETYIDVHICNPTTATHHRVGALGRGLPPELKRLTEDHGVCISSCIDNWDDDLILQAFNRNLILAPEIYGNPWLMRDDEFPKLARIYNLHRKYRDILQEAIVLPESKYGPTAVSRGDKKTRLITCRNLTWKPVKYRVNLDQEIGLLKKGSVHVRRFHPHEEILGDFKYGQDIEIEVPPFRSYLLLVTTGKCDEPNIKGCEFDVIKNVEGSPVKIVLRGESGTTKEITIDGKSDKIKFEGQPLKLDYHRKLGVLSQVNVPENAGVFYEATCYAADNNALEVRSLKRSGETKIPEVKAARDAFFYQNVFMQRGLWDKNLFDGDLETSFFATKRKDRDYRINEGCLRIDLGSIKSIDYMKFIIPDFYSLLPCEIEEGRIVEVSKDLQHWEQITAYADLNMRIPINTEIRYLRMLAPPSRISEVKAYKDGKELNRSVWRASNLFAHTSKMTASKAWKGIFKIEEVSEGSYLCVAINGKHGVEGVYAAAKVDGEYIGAPDRAASYPSNVWENELKKVDSNYTYYIPLKKEYEGKDMEVITLGFNEDLNDLNIEVWQTNYDEPMVKRMIHLK